MKEKILFEVYLFGIGQQINGYSVKNDKNESVLLEVFLNFFFLKPVLPHTDICLCGKLHHPLSDSFYYALRSLKNYQHLFMVARVDSAHVQNISFL